MFLKTTLTFLVVGALSVNALTIPIARSPVPEPESQELEAWMLKRDLSYHLLSRELQGLHELFSREPEDWTKSARDNHATKREPSPVKKPIAKPPKPKPSTQAANDDSYALAAKREPSPSKKPSPKPVFTPKPDPSTQAANDSTYALAAKREPSPAKKPSTKPPKPTQAANDDSYALAAKREPSPTKKPPTKPPKPTQAANDSSYALAARK